MITLVLQISLSVFYINEGAELIFYQHHFKVLDADEYAKKFMETNPELFPKA
jgi:hypothetical protein